MACSICEICGERLPEGFATGLLPSAAGTAAGANASGEATLFELDYAAAPRCGLCLRAKPAYEKAVAFGTYDGELRDLIHLLKYEHVLPATHVLAEMLATAVVPILPRMAADTIVIPVPLHTARRQERGFNQADALLDALLRQLAAQPKGAGRGFRARLDVLVRVRPTKSQTGLTRPQRRANVKGAFQVSRTQAKAIAGRDVLLIDDVFTTGTTVAECARVLKRAGASRVWVATVARVVKGDSQNEADSRMQIAEIDLRNLNSNPALPEAYRPKDPGHSGMF